MWAHPDEESGLGLYAEHKMLALGRLSVSARCGSRPSTARVIPVAELRSNVTMLAKLAKLMKIPVTTTASAPNGANGPLMPELKEHVPDAERCFEFNTFDRTSQQSSSASRCRPLLKDCDSRH